MRSGQQLPKKAKFIYKLKKALDISVESRRPRKPLPNAIIVRVSPRTIALPNREHNTKECQKHESEPYICDNCKTRFPKIQNKKLFPSLPNRNGPSIQQPQAKTTPNIQQPQHTTITSGNHVQSVPQKRRQDVFKTCQFIHSKLV